MQRFVSFEACVDSHHVNIYVYVYIYVFISIYICLFLCFIHKI